MKLLSTRTVTRNALPTALAVKPDFWGTLPSTVQQMLLRSLQATRELKELEVVRIPRGTPSRQRKIYRDRIAELRLTVDSALRIMVALKRGYQPYTIPASWYAGYVEEPKGEPNGALAYELTRQYGMGLCADCGRRHVTKEVYVPLRRIFDRPLPPDVLTTYVPLRKEGLFDAFLVAAPNPEFFVLPSRTVSGSLYIEPALVGYIEVEGGVGMGLCFASSQQKEPHIRMANGIGFLVAYWDLSDDLEWSTK